MIKISPAQFDTAVTSLSEILKKRFSMPLKKTKAQEVLANTLGFNNYNTFIGLSNTDRPQSIFDVIKNADLVRIGSLNKASLYWVNTFEQKNLESEDKVAEFEHSAGQDEECYLTMEEAGRLKNTGSYWEDSNGDTYEFMTIEKVNEVAPKKKHQVVIARIENGDSVLYLDGIQLASSENGDDKENIIDAVASNLCLVNNVELEEINVRVPPVQDWGSEDVTLYLKERGDLFK